MEIAHQLGELFLGAVPTVIIVLLFYVFMRWAFFTPIQKAMAERKALIEGARAEAATVEAAAKQELDTYNQTLKKRPGRNLRGAGKCAGKPSSKSARSCSEPCAAARRKK